MDRVKNVEAAPKVARSSSPIPIAFLIFLIAYILNTIIQRYLDRFIRCFSNISIGRIRDIFPSRSTTSPEPLKEGDVVRINDGRHEDEYYPFQGYTESGKAILSDHTPNCTFIVDLENVEKVETATDPGEIVVGQECRCIVDMWVYDRLGGNKLTEFKKNDRIRVIQDVGNGFVLGSHYYFPSRMLKPVSSICCF